MKYTFWVTISYKYGKSPKALLKAVKEGLYMVQRDYPNASRIAKENDGKTCFMKMVEDPSIPKAIQQELAIDVL